MTFHLEDDAICTPWSDENFDLTQPVVIPCGKCISTLSISGELILSSGLDIQGRLLLDNTNPLLIKTPYVTNQGVLSIPSLSPKIEPSVSPPRVEIVMTGTDHHMFMPHMDNMHACDMMTGCNVSNRAIVTAGGKLDVTAWPEDACKTWTRIKRVGSSGGASDSYDELTVDVAGSVGCWGAGGTCFSCYFWVLGWVE